MTPTILSFAAAASALLAIAADWEERRHKSFYLLKPLTTLLILGVAATLPAQSGDTYRAFVLGALALSLAGDVCLMFEGDAWFIGGLGSFLLAHLLFIPAFLSGVPAYALPWWSALLAIYAAVLAAKLLRHAGPLKLPVLVYVLALSGLALAATMRHQALPSGAALLALAGALFFVASDSALGIRRFLGPFRGAQALILSTYWTAIGLIAWSV